MRISFAGGAEYFNCDKLFAAGIWPITVATTILKPGGYNRLLQMVEKVDGSALPPLLRHGHVRPSVTCPPPAQSDFHHVKDPSSPCPAARATSRCLGWTASRLPARAAVPSSRISPEYIGAGRKGAVRPALKLITEKNALPFTTGTICAHRCQTKCTRNFYDESVRIRDTKLVAAERAMRP